MEAKTYILVFNTTVQIDGGHNKPIKTVITRLQLHKHYFLIKNGIISTQRAENVK